MSETGGEPSPPPSPTNRAARIEDAWQAWRVRRGMRLGHQRTVIPFGGYGHSGRVRLLARVVLVPPRRQHPEQRRVVRGWRSFTSPPVPGAEVTAVASGEEFTVHADRGGVIDTWTPITLKPGWHDIELRIGDDEPVISRVFVVADTTEIGVVCDIDDTVMVTALPRPFLAAWNSFVRDEHARRPVPGMAVLLERLHRHYPDGPIIYLSTGAWNVHPTLTRFLTRHIYPAGTLLLTDWGPTHDRWFRSGQEHKIRNLESLARDFPNIRWILIGDDGQHDEDIYGAFAQSHPDNVRAIAIRELLAPEALLAGGRSHHDRTADPEQIPWVSAPNGAGLAAEFRSLGIIE